MKQIFKSTYETVTSEPLNFHNYIQWSATSVLLAVLMITFPLWMIFLKRSDNNV